MASNSVENFATKAAFLVERTLFPLRSLSFDAASELPEASSQEVELAGIAASISIFRYDLGIGADKAVLVVAMVAKTRLLGMVSEHTEGGLVFLKNGSVREASAAELENSGG